jgi:hypothetical protein
MASRIGVFPAVVDMAFAAANPAGASHSTGGIP